MTLSAAEGPTSVPLLSETIPQNLARTVAEHGGRDALVSVEQGLRYTYTEFAGEVDRVARGLMGIGVAKGDRVGIWSPNYAEWVLVQYATARIGAILVTINPAYRSSELEYVLNQSQISVLVAVESFLTSDYRSMITEVWDRAPAERVVYLHTSDWDTLLEAAGTVSADRLEERSAQLEPDDAVNIQYTSGTTGFPKGATLSHRNILNNGLFTGEACKYTAEDRVCIPVPFYHCFGMVLGNLACTTHGSAMVIPAAGFNPTATLKAVAAERCTSLYGVPTMFIAELGEPDLAGYDLSSLRTGIMAGSPCPIEVMRQVVDQMNMSEVTIAYGMTETSPVSTQTSADDPLEKRVTTVGRVHPHVEIRIVDPATGEVVPRGTGGEFQTRGYSVMLGYWNDPERTAEAIDADGWMHTGDLAVMDGEGYVNIVGRIKDMIIRGGENVYPREVEEFLYTHPDIVDVQVIGVPDVRYGEEIMAWVQLRDGAGATADDIKDFCRGTIAHYKVPRYIKITDTFPMTITGKVRKFKMREQSIEELRLDEAAQVQSA
ncbi:MAG: AMP-binding protein [Acidimicrobiaceae bacterium]|nr:AMP-binding protein [Acidimicrobiaceae bacterium]MYE97628.1 AMP-binding protein [Acidimicrobiaceae bacterium]MYH44733.1 AMP-binding protein [Acidimicrobiaceae bacterium]MYI53494.1 AMP-binding protein [Acidimicrobiaceae bacterium]MYJ82087.1 AMP-binding protein [Acidimicrobiaceae bacterium]